jgi:hypothetical protein
MQWALRHFMPCVFGAQGDDRDDDGNNSDDNLLGNDDENDDHIQRTMDTNIESEARLTGLIRNNREQEGFFISQISKHMDNNDKVTARTCYNKAKQYKKKAEFYEGALQKISGSSLVLSQHKELQMLRGTMELNAMAHRIVNNGDLGAMVNVQSNFQEHFGESKDLLGQIDDMFTKGMDMEQTESDDEGFSQFEQEYVLKRLDNAKISASDIVRPVTLPTIIDVTSPSNASEAPILDDVE